ncbi:acriflavin resistance protein [Bradyrhizobium sp. NP1]|uniref:acriflavin resistance protein n=1 Tax=Bradyrhizobium sp. NP1 TaxID=3049772 RepID=UPI0025A5B8E8|nr:acriflavin resistance protein [Bradyrhizobium sp. NP1]WJR75409.1 acriflavin resistance protein [Bradyrhizobium sp. NP1]
MTITGPILNDAAELADFPGEAVASLLQVIGDHTGLFGDDPEGALSLVMSGLAGLAAALAVAIVLSVAVADGWRTRRHVVRHGIAAFVTLGLVAFVVYDMRHATLAFLGLNVNKPAIEFEIRLPKAALSEVAETQVELHTDRNQQLARVVDRTDAEDGRSVLRGSVTLDYRTTNRTVILSLPGRAQCVFRLRLAANPSRSDQFGPWHLADQIDAPSPGEAGAIRQDAFAIRYRVL